VVEVGAGVGLAATTGVGEGAIWVGVGDAVGDGTGDGVGVEVGEGVGELAGG
jgi:hypothetical protein